MLLGFIVFALLATSIRASSHSSKSAQPRSLSLPLPPGGNVSISSMNATQAINNESQVGGNATLTYDNNFVELLLKGFEQMEAFLGPRCPSLQLFKVEARSSGLYSPNLAEFKRMKIFANCNDRRGNWLGAVSASNIYSKPIVFNILGPRKTYPTGWEGDWPARGFDLAREDLHSLQEVNAWIRSVPPLKPSIAESGPWWVISLDEVSARFIFGQTGGGLLGYTFRSFGNIGATWLRLDMRRLCTRSFETRKLNCRSMPKYRYPAGPTIQEQ